MRKPILENLKTRTLIIDGAMGTLLLESGVPADTCFELANRTHPEIIRKVHRAYLDAGADIIETNTFGGSPLKLAHYGLADQAFDLNKLGVSLAREAAGEDSYVAASMGPCGKLIEPVGITCFEDVYNGFAIQAKAFEAGGADIVSIETMGDLAELKAAILAVKDNTRLPVICSVTYDKHYRTMTGSDPYLVMVTLAAMGVDIIGTNCGMGPDGMIDVLGIYLKAVEENALSVTLSVMPNAGLPVVIDNRTVYPMDGKSFAQYVPRFLELGVSIVGGCCGTTPAHIAAVRKTVPKSHTLLTPSGKSQNPHTVLTSRSKQIVISDQHLPVVIGERLNPTARKQLAEDLIGQKTELYHREARAQLEHAPALLDVNVGYPGINEAEAMQQVVMMLTRQFDVPLCLDSSNPMVLERGLRVYPGKALINSVNGEEKSLNAVLPLARKYGAAVIGLTLDEKGIPGKAEERLAIARRIVDRAQDFGIPKQDIFIDTLVLAASSNQAEVLETIRAVTLVKEKLGVRTSLGISNVSHGLPKRKLINHTFLAMALGAGLDAVIANPADPYLAALIASSAVLTNRDRACTNYVRHHEQFLVADSTAAAQQVASTVTAAADGRLDDLKASLPLYDIARKVVEGDSDAILQLVEDARSRFPAQEIMEKALLRGMEVVGEDFKVQKVFLPQVMASAETMKKAFAYLKSFMQKDAAVSRGTAVIATVKGDIHDIGKNIVAMMLENNGFEVIDLGKNVDSEVIIDAVSQHKADILCLSSLLTTTMPEMEVIINKCQDRGLPVRIMVGGAVVNKAYADKIGAHYAADAIEAAERAAAIMKY